VTTQTITVPVAGNPTFESDETFFVTLSGPTNASITTFVGTGTIHAVPTAPIPPHIDSLGFSQYPNNRLLLRPVNVTDPDDAVVSVAFYYETDGVLGLQLVPGGDTLIFTATNSPWYAIVLYRGGVYYAQAMDASGLLSNVVQVFVGPKPLPLPGADFAPLPQTSSAPALQSTSSPSAGGTSLSTQSGLWNGESAGLTWLPTSLFGNKLGSDLSSQARWMAHTLTNQSNWAPGSGIWDVLNPNV